MTGSDQSNSRAGSSSLVTSPGPATLPPMALGRRKPTPETTPTPEPTPGVTADEVADLEFDSGVPVTTTSPARAGEDEAYL